MSTASLLDTAPGGSPTDGAVPTVTKPTQNKSKLTQLRASIACTNCRRRKVKCNVQSLKPGEACKLCSNTGGECVVIYDDNRKKNSSKRYVRQLEERLESLESALKTVADREPLRTPPVPTPQLQLDSSSPRPAFIEMESPISLQPAAHPRRLTMESVVAETTSTSSPATGAQSRHSAAGISVLDEAAAFPKDNVPQNLEPQSLPHELRFADGLHFNIFDSGISGNHTPFLSQFPQDFDTEMYESEPNHNGLDLMLSSHWLDLTPMEVALGLQSDINDTFEFRVKCFEKLFKVQEGVLYMVHPRLFLRGHETNTRTEYYSAFASDAVMACALCLKDDESVRSLSRVYADRAKNKMFENLEDPNMSTITALCYLGDYECMSGNENLGWFYVGTACRLVLDLSLHRDCTDLVSKGLMSREDAINRQRMAFGCFVYESIWSMFLGRPGSMKASHLSLLRLSSLSSDPETQLMSSWVGLSTQMAKLVDIFNRPMLNNGKSWAKLRKLDTSLSEWNTMLPPDFRSINEPLGTKSSHVYILHMQFCNTQILLHKMVAANCARLTPVGYSEKEMYELWPYTREESQNIIHDNAIKIARSLETSRLAFGDMGFATLMLDIIFTAASSLIMCMTSSGSSKTALKDQKWLMCFLETCEGLQIHYPVVGRMLAVLNSLMDSTGLSSFIWRGPDVASTFASSTSSSQNTGLEVPLASALVVTHSVRSAPFELKRWCGDGEVPISSLPTPPHLSDCDLVPLGIM